MRLSLSLTLWLVVVSALVLAAHGWSQLSEEEEDLYAAAGRELSLVATAVRSAVENAVRDSQDADIGPLLEQLELRDPAFDIFVFEGNEDLLGSSWGSATNLERARVMAHSEGTANTLRFERLVGGDVAVVTPFKTRNHQAGRIVILRPPSVLRVDLQEERNAMIAGSLTLVGLISAAIWTVLHFRLQRPISQMIAVVHRVTGGDLTARIGRAGSDELAVLAAEFDSMVEALEQTRQRLSVEAETREKLQAEMLRANRLAIVGELAATLAHEIGSPLQVLGGRAEDIARRAELPTAVTRDASIVVEQVERLHRIVERFLDVARRRAPSKTSVGLHDAVRQVTELLAAQFRRKDIRVESAVAPDLVVSADPGQLQQVLLNLLQNAVRASQRGATVRIGGSASSFRPFPDAASQASIALTIEDEGAGVPDEMSNIVFQPFFTAWSADSNHPTGTGLGLSVVKTIMADHGGLVRVERASTHGGACFVCHFPAPVDRLGNVG